jgi:hypothetical protein
VVLSHLRLGSVGNPSRNRGLPLEPSIAYRLLQPTRNPGTPRTRDPHAIERFHALPLPTTETASAVSDSAPKLQYALQRLVALADASKASAEPAGDDESALRAATQEANSFIS